jgi:hypothetical protein
MRSRTPVIPDWTRDLASMLEVADESGHNVEAWCGRCREYRHLKRPELERIAAAKGLGYSLFIKRTRCRMTEGCRGWVTFRYERGPWAYALFDEETESRWMQADMPGRG